MKIFESLKKTFTNKKIEINPTLPANKIQADLSNSNNFNYFDSYNDLNNPSSFLGTKVPQQEQKINLYRQTAELPDVANAIDEITNEVVYSEDFKNVLNIDIEIDAEKTKTAIIQNFQKLIKLMRLDLNIWQMFRQTYIDGQINIHLTYHEKGGIKSIKILDPRQLYFDFSTQKYRYYENIGNTFNQNLGIFGNSFVFEKSLADNTKFAEYDMDEIIHWNFGLFSSDKLILSYLEKTIKVSNQLKTLEDLLIPLRFSRSVSRRVFNIDIANMPTSKAEAYMRKIQDQFKYKKFYNAETGEVANQQHVVSMVEDYWFANRSGNKGTQVETLDETGNLGEIEDVLYFQKKLYNSLNIPSNRLQTDESQIGFEDDSILREEYKFYQFIQRIRRNFCCLFLDILEKGLISEKILKQEEFNILKEKINIYFTTENPFFENTKLKTFLKKVEAYEAVREYSGKIFSLQKVFKEIFKWNDEEIEKNLNEIKIEKENELFKSFYETNEDDY